MRMPRPRHLLVLLLAAACSEQVTDPEPEVASVLVGPASASIQVGSEVQFTATALSASGGTISGREVTWSSSAEAVATIDAAGLATGVSTGTTQISATIDGVTSPAQTLTVVPVACAGGTDVVLDPGEYQVFVGGDCLVLPAGSNGDLYRVAVGRPSIQYLLPGNTLPVTLTLTPDLAAVGDPAVAEAQASDEPAAVLQDDLELLDPARALERLRWQEGTRRFHNQLRLYERSLDLSPNALLPGRGLAGAPMALVPPPAEDSMYLEPACTAEPKQHVTLVSYSDNLAVYQETAERDTAEISVAAADELIAYYDTYVRDMVVDYWGAIPDVDANGRVNVVTSTQLGEGVAGAVFSADYYVDSPTCRSNEGETIYFLGELMRLFDDPDPFYFGLGVVAHEAKHVVSIYNAIERGDLLGKGPEFHDLWIEEGTAEVAHAMSSRAAWAATGGPALGTPITRTDILTAVQANGGRETKEMSGVVDVIAGLIYSFAVQPNSVITDPTGAPPEHSFYANSWLWHRFLGDGYGGASTALADTAFFRALTDPDTPAGGASGEILLTGSANFDELFEEFLVAVSLHGSGFAAPHPIDTWDFVSAGSIFRNPNPDGDFPWPVTATEVRDSQGNTISLTQWAPFAAATYDGTIGPSGARFHDFRSSGTAGARIELSGSGADDAIVIVTRLD